MFSGTLGMRIETQYSTAIVTRVLPHAPVQAATYVQQAALDRALLPLTWKLYACTALSKRNIHSVIVCRPTYRIESTRWHYQFENIVSICYLPT